MQKNKKKAIIISVIVVLIGVIVWMFIWNGSPLGRLLSLFKDDGITTSEKIAKIISDTKPTDIIIRGDNVYFEEDVTYRHTEEITKNGLVSSYDYEYTILVINDLNNNVLLTDEEQKSIEMAIKEDNFCLIYLGEKYAERWENEDTSMYSVEGNICFMFFSIDGMLQKRIGMLNDTDREDLEKYSHMLGDTLLHCFSYYLEEVD